MRQQKIDIPNLTKEQMARIRAIKDRHKCIRELYQYGLVSKEMLVRQCKI
jgi:hypothetical protein